MKCMKCAREIGEGQVFCTDCLAEMEKYPIKPGTAVLLPRQSDPSAKKAAHHRPVSSEETIRIFQKRIQFLSLGWAITLLILVGVCFFMIHHLKNDPQVLPGQNYSVISSDPTEG